MVDNPKNCVYTPPVATLQGERQTKSRAVAQSGSALAWGARGRGFESRLPDEIKGSAMVTTAAEPFCFIFTRGNRTHDPAAKGEWAANASGMSRPCAAGTPPGGKPVRAAGGG